MNDIYSTHSPSTPVLPHHRLHAFNASAGGGRMRNGQVAAQEPSSLSKGEALREP